MEKQKLLIVEDDEAIRTQMKWALDDDYAVLLAEDRESALQGFQAEDPAIVILDLGLPPVPRGPDEGFQTLAEILSIDPGAKVIVITGNHEKKTALRAVDLGAFDFFAKPADMNEVRFVLKRALHMATLERENLALKKTAYRQGFEEIIAGSRVMKELFTLVRKVSTTDASVLLVGESGTGKELVAKAIHRLSSRSQAPFIAINCGAIPEALLESELFGHEKGSFTGAYAQKKGRIEYADGGTLFLDEIGDLTLPLQVKLLRFLQERLIERVGGHEKIPVDVRVVAATNRVLDHNIREGSFREDLFYRLSVINVAIPPLRDRGEDIVLIARAFLSRFSSELKKPVRDFSADALARMRKYPWPGNVRELENRVKRAVIMGAGSFITAGDLELDHSSASDKARTLKEFREKMEREHVRTVLMTRRWNVSKAAIDLDVSRPTLHALIKKYNLNREK